MDQLAMLWQYQVEDRKADKLEQELSRSPLRQKMNTCRTQFNAKQKQYKQMEEQVAILSDARMPSAMPSPAAKNSCATCKAASSRILRPNWMIRKRC